MWDFLTFRKMLIPVLIQILFWVGTIACVVGGLMVTTGAAAVPKEAAMVRNHVLAGAALIFLGPFILRIYCELLIVVFRMNDTLTEIRNNTMGRR